MCDMTARATRAMLGTGQHSSAAAPYTGTSPLAADLPATTGPTAYATIVSVGLEVYAGIGILAVGHLRIFTLDDALTLFTIGGKDPLSLR